MANLKQLHFTLNVHSFMYTLLSRLIYLSIFPTTDTRPTLLQLTHLVTPSGKTIRIIESIASKWKVVGIHLNFDPTGNTINYIGANHPFDPEACCTEMMMKWLGGRGRQPANWATLVRVLKNAGFSVLAVVVEQLVLTPADGGREGGGVDSIQSTCVCVCTCAMYSKISLLVKTVITISVPFAFSTIPRCTTRYTLFSLSKFHEGKTN